MKIFEKVKRLIISAAAVSMSAMLLLPGVVASAGSDNNGLGKIDMNKAASLSVYYYSDSSGDIPAYGKMQGVKVNAYKIASISETGQFSPVAPFDSLGIDITDMTSIADQDKWDSIITEAGKVIAAGSVTPSYTATSDAEGYARFGTVDKGLYIGISDSVVIEQIQYKYFDFLAVVPGPNNLEANQSEDWGRVWDGTWTNANYDVIAIPKREAVQLEGDPEPFTVFKQWADNGSTNRPKNISVKIFCDGELKETVQLSSENNWKYTWEYEKGHNFSVEEVIEFEGYTPSISRKDNSFVIVNTKNPEEPEKPEKPEKPHKPEKPEKPQKPGTPETPTTPSVPNVLGAIRDFVGELPEVLGARRLPQTGQLWWPIPILAILGVVLIALGFRSEKHRK